MQWQFISEKSQIALAYIWGGIDTKLFVGNFLAFCLLCLEGEEDPWRKVEGVRGERSGKWPPSGEWYGESQFVRDCQIGQECHTGTNTCTTSSDTCWSLTVFIHRLYFKVPGWIIMWISGVCVVSYYIQA